MTAGSLLKRLALNTDERSLSHRFRQKRFEWLTTRLAALPKPVRVLDVGGTEIFWRRMDYGFSGEIELTLLNLREEVVSLPFARSVAATLAICRASETRSSISLSRTR